MDIDSVATEPTTLKEVFVKFLCRIFAHQNNFNFLTMDADLYFFVTLYTMSIFATSKKSIFS